MVVGPGLGRNPVTMKQVSQFLQMVQDMNKVLVIDADGLWIIAQNPSLIKGYKKAVLTPNFMEFRRLWSSLDCQSTVVYHPGINRCLTVKIIIVITKTHTLFLSLSLSLSHLPQR